MDSASKDLYYQKINELLQDEEKIITCISLSDNLEIPIDDAKAVLTDFVQDFHKDIRITFILSGIKKKCNGLAVHLVKEEDLTEKTAFFETIYTKFIYSIQKNKDTNLNSIVMVDNDNMSRSSKLLGMVVGKNCLKRNVKKSEILETKQGEQKNGNEYCFKKVNSSNINGTSNTEIQNNQSSQEKSTKVKPASSITNFFTKSSLKTGIQNENIKSPSSKADNVSNNGEDKKRAEKENCVEKMDIDLASNTQHSQTTGSKKRKKAAKADNGATKRRKRIQEICDSDSDDIFSDEKEDIIEKSDNELEFVSKMETFVPARKKVRKTIDETHMDEEGFLVTTTKYIYESTSEDEKEQIAIKTTEQPKVLSQKKNNTTEIENDTKKQQRKGKNNKKATTGKQSTLMNFFKRK